MSPISIFTCSQSGLLQVSAQPSTGMHHFTHAEPLRLTRNKALQGTGFPRNLRSTRKACRRCAERIHSIYAHFWGLCLRRNCCNALAGFPLPAGSFHSSRTSHAGPGAGLNRIEKRHLYERLDPVSLKLLSYCLAHCIMPSCCAGCTAHLHSTPCTVAARLWYFASIVPLVQTLLGHSCEGL